MASPSLKHRVIAAGFRALAASGLERVLERVARGVGAILMFHHVRPPSGDPFQPNALLEITPEFLDAALALVRRRGFDIVPMDDVPARLVRPSRPGGRPFVALTFDDGYRDNVEHAAPILARHDAPWTLYLTTEFAAGSGRLWWVELEEVVRRSDRLRVAIDGVRLDLPAGDPAAKDAAFARLYRALRAGPEDAMRETLAGLCAEAGMDTDALTRRLCLGWPEIDALSRRPEVTFGAHTVSHPMLAKHPAEAARREIAEGRAILEARLGRPVRHLAYPVGDPGSAGPREFAMAREAGFATAVTTRPGQLFPGHARDPHALPRVSVNGPHQSEPALSSLLSGVPFLLWNRGRRLDVR